MVSTRKHFLHTKPDIPEEPACLHLRQKSHLNDKLSSFLFDYSSVSHGLDYAPPVNLATKASVLPVPGMAIMSLFKC